MQPDQQIDSEVAANLGLDRGPRHLRRWGIWALVALLALGAFAWWRHRAAAAHQGTAYVTAPVERGDLAVTVTATGTLEALDTVDVSSEVSGRISSIPVDFNDRVKAGEVLATLDPTQARERANEAAAQVQSAKAALVKAQASAHDSSVKLRRQEALANTGLISKDDLDTARATDNRNDADIAAARAQIAQAEASFKEAQTALQKTSIVSPIDGIVLARNVEVGNTVAASLQAPVLFQIARDLTKMTLKVQVDEADVGKVREGESAAFTVDAYPNRNFPSRVRQLRNVAKTDQNVVTYEALLDVDNPDLALRPGMTGTATIHAEDKADVLLVPNAALRFTPPDVLAAQNGPRGGLFIPGVTRGSPFGRRGGQQGRPGQGGQGPGSPQGQGSTAPGAAGQNGQGPAPPGREQAGPGRGSWRGGEPGGQAGAQGAGGRGHWRGQGASAGGGAASGAGFGQGRDGGSGGTRQRVWVLKDGKPEPVFVGAGATDGTHTEVVWGHLQQGDAVIVDIATSTKGTGS